MLNHLSTALQVLLMRLSYSMFIMVTVLGIFRVLIASGVHSLPPFPFPFGDASAEFDGHASCDVHSQPPAPIHHILIYSVFQFHPRTNLQTFFYVSARGHAHRCLSCSAKNQPERRDGRVKHLVGRLELRTTHETSSPQLHLQRLFRHCMLHGVASLAQKRICGCKKSVKSRYVRL